MDSVYDPTDQQWMRYALALAAKGQGHVEPNPMVGCVILKDGQPIAEGYHRQFGDLHAEREAIADAGPGADLSGATWYVTLEPCCHHGKTPPCSEALIASKPSRVVIASKDPFEEVSGRGVQELQHAGIQVDVGVCESEANRLNAAYLKRVQSRRPWVIAKWAMTLDGKIASRSGDSKWISGEASRAKAHALRGRVDGIVVGSGTVIADDPLLTARSFGDDSTSPARIARRIVLDSTAKTPINSQLAQSANTAPVTLVVNSDATAERIEALRAVGCDILKSASSDRTATVNQLLDHCYELGMTNVMVEGGGEALAAFFEANAIDEFQIYIAAKVIGGREATGPVGGLGLDKISESPMLEGLQVEAIDGDLFVSTRRK